MTTALAPAAPELVPLTPAPDDRVRGWVKRLAPVMFGLAFVHLLAFAGLIHRADERYHVTGFEKVIIYGTLFGLWPLFVIEAWVGFAVRDRSRRAGPMFARAVVVCLFPPVRMGMIHPVSGLIWLPRLGWERPGKALLARLDRGFGVPLLLFALLVVPVLGIEYVWAEAVKGSPAFALVLHACLAVIWVAFATEFLLKVQASGAAVKYVKERWVDAAIVLLPTLEFVLTMWAEAAPIARLLRTARAVAPDQLARMGQMYRLRGLLMKGWHAMLALELFARLLGDNPRKRLARLEAEIAAAEEELAALRVEADAVRAKMTVAGAER